MAELAFAKTILPKIFASGSKSNEQRTVTEMHFDLIRWVGNLLANSRSCFTVESLDMKDETPALLKLLLTWVPPVSYLVLDTTDFDCSFTPCTAVSPSCRLVLT